MTLTDRSVAPPTDRSDFWIILAGQAWRAVVRAILRMPLLFLSSIVLMAGVEYAFATIYTAWPELLYGTKAVQVSSLIILERGVLSLATSGAQALLVAPVAVAVHRFILLGQVTPGGLSLGPAHTRQFIAWVIAVQFLFLATVLQELASEVSPWAGLATFLLAFIPAVVVALRMALIFPAVAIDVPAIGWRDRVASSWRMTRGRVWMIVVASTVAFLPFIVLSLTMNWLKIVPLHPYTADMAALRWRYFVHIGILAPVGSATGAAVVSLIYRDAIQRAAPERAALI